MHPSTPPPGGLDSPEFLDRVRAAVAPRYEVVRMVGWGGMAAVFLARETRLGREVALKVMAPQLMADRGMVDRFAHEARTTAQLTSPWVVTVFDVDERAGLHFFTMRYVGGRTLAQVMDWSAAPPLPIPVIRTWMAQVGGALAHAHRRGVIHRDVKPSNVLLDVDGTALVSDFGIAKLVLGDPNLTQTGLIVGTPTYMSPEQCIGDPTTPASDQYAFGAVAYQMISGQPPFSGPTLTVLNAQVSEAPPPLLARRPDCPPELAAAVERMLAKRPDERWDGMEQALEAAGAVVPPPSDAVWPLMERWAAPVAGVVVETAPQTLQVGAAGRIVAFAVDAAGRRLEDRRIDWQSGAESVLVVGPGGTLDARGPGVVTVVGRSDGAEARVTLAIRPRDTVLLPALPIPPAHPVPPAPVAPPISDPTPSVPGQAPGPPAELEATGEGTGAVPVDTGSATAAMGSTTAAKGARATSPPAGGDLASGDGSARRGPLAGGVAALLVFLVGGWLLLRPTTEDSGGTAARISAAADSAGSDPGVASDESTASPPAAEEGAPAPATAPAETSPGDRPAGEPAPAGGNEAPATPPEATRPDPPVIPPGRDPGPVDPEPAIAEEETPPRADPDDTVPAVEGPGTDLTPPAAGADPPDADIQQITAIARGIMEAVANADEDRVRGAAPGFTGSEPWWVFMADSAGDYTRTVRLLPQTQVVPIGNTATVILSLSVDLADEGGEVVESRTWPLTMRFLRSGGIWSLDDLR